MTPSQPPDTTLGASGARLTALDAPTAALVRLAARVTAGDEAAVRDGFAECTAVKVPAGWVEELILQAIKETTMHEVGHTLGLRHNFKASKSAR